MREYYLPFLYVALFIGYEISFYLIYQYNKLKKKKIPLNKIILAYGLLSGLGMSGVFLRTIITYYIEDVILKAKFNKFSHVLVALGIIVFLFTLSIKSFNEIVNVLLTRIVIIPAIIISIIIVLTNSKDIEFFLIIISIIIGSIYLTYAHYKIIKKIPIKAKKRIFLVFIGFTILLSSIIFRAEEFLKFYPEDLQEEIEIITIPLILLGLLIVLFGTYRFPILLEIDWQDKFIELFIIDSKSNEILYSYNLSNEKNNNMKNNKEEYLSKSPEKQIIFSKGISDIEIFISNFVNKKESINKISHGNQVIFIRHGDNSLHNLLLCVTAREELNSLNYFLNSIKKQFQKSFEKIIVNRDLSLEEKKRILLGFNTYIKNFLE
ncbi:MAG: hypothetical protein KGD57_00320 [Candidatus Lokiarchaeota archaeon]|nr:hypothetical protein [Candidatus Lokiarchaeota archaeon]